MQNLFRYEWLDSNSKDSQGFYGPKRILQDNLCSFRNFFKIFKEDSARPGWWYDPSIVDTSRDPSKRYAHWFTERGNTFFWENEIQDLKSRRQIKRILWIPGLQLIEKVVTVKESFIEDNALYSDEMQIVFYEDEIESYVKKTYTLMTL